MMTLLLLYAYCVGIVSSRKIERACYEDLAFRVLTGNQQPDHSRISEFRRRNLEALSELFVQILRLCQKAGMVSLGHVALDGTKVQANASKHKAMSHERMLKAEEQLEKEINALMRRAEILDAQEDEQYGKGKLGSELPEELQRRQERLEKIRQARLELEAEAAAEGVAAAPARERAEQAAAAEAAAAEQKPRNRRSSAGRWSRPRRKPRRPGTWRSRRPSRQGWNRPIWSRCRLMRCRVGVWPTRPMAAPPPRPSATSQIPTATSCRAMETGFRATTARRRWMAITR
jgi:hypothetical protein